MAERRPNPLVQLSLTQWRLYFRSPGVLVWTVAVPLVISLLVGLAYRRAPEVRAQVAVLPSVQHDGLVQTLRGASIDVIELGPDEATRALRSGRVSLLVTQPAPDQPIELSFDPSRPEGVMARTLVRDALEHAAGRTDRVAVTEHQVVQPGQRYIDFLLPGLLGLSLLNGGLTGVGYGIAEMRMRRQLRRLSASPMRRWHFLVSFLVLRVMTMAIELPILVGVATLVVGVPFRGNPLVFALVAVVGGLSCACIGMALAARAPNPATMSGVINLLTLPLTLASGVFFPTERFPSSVRPVLEALPLAPVISSLRAVMLDGAGLASLGQPLAIVLAWGLCAFAATLAWFRWR